jgi:hypothetical protein
MPETNGFPDTNLITSYQWWGMKNIEKSRITKPRRGRAQVTAVSVSVLIALAACQRATEPRLPAVPGWVRATFLEAPTSDAGSEFEGIAKFAMSGSAASGIDPAFQLFNNGIGGDERESITFFKSGQDQPPPGRYKLAPLTFKNGQPRGFTAYYLFQGATELQTFTALSGSVTIDRSTSDEVDGTFEITLVQTCKDSNPPGPGDWCAPTPNHITPGAKQIIVNGSFHATSLLAEPVDVGVGHIGDS